MAAGGTNTGTSNVAAVVVDGGPACAYSQGQGQVNLLYTTVVVCAPGSTTNCQTIDHVQVDTGSYGLRILHEALQPSLAAALATVKEKQSGEPLATCAMFADGYSWGPIKSVDLQIAGERASGLEIQVIGDPAYSTVPTDCSNPGGSEEDTVAQFGANGLLGVGPFVPDCGTGCAPGHSVPAWYFLCPTPSSCQVASMGVAFDQQVSNPVAFFTNASTGAHDNNGVIIELPQVASGGAPSVQGALVFGIDTDPNSNAMTASAVLRGDAVNGNITTLFNNATFPQSYIDSGSNALYFEDATLPPCSLNQGFYCPTSPKGLTAINQGSGGTPQSTVDFTVGDADHLNPPNAAFDDLAGCPVSSSGSTCSSGSQTFDWGLPFFFGRSVYTAIACNVDGATCQTTSQGFGPYFAY